MGEMINFVCGKCGEEYSVFYGNGFRFYKEYEDTVLALEKGEYGSEWKELFLNNKYVAIDAESYVYFCKKCGNWQEERGLSLYIPRNKEIISKEYNKYSAIMNSELRRNYRILKRRIHKCSKCGKIMHKANFEEFQNLKCPKCGGKPSIAEFGYWD